MFVTGHLGMGCVQVRAVQLARALGWPVVHDLDLTEDKILAHDVFILVRPDIHPSELRRYGTVIYDIVDFVPPKTGVDFYISTSRNASSYFPDLDIRYVPQHHCNFSNIPNPMPETRKVVFLGAAEWRPTLPGIDFQFFDASIATVEKLDAMYRKTDIALNFRSPNSADSSQRYKQHIAINGGIKLVNCIGYGVPSVSSPEPSYLELGEDFTVFATHEQCKEAVDRLVGDDDLYRRIRTNCIRKAQECSLQAVAEKYRQVILGE
jgi:hypothetical protein